jgi:hypothetical protein
MSRKKESRSRMNRTKTLCALLLLAPLLSVYAQGREVSAVGGWTKTIDASNLVSGAGSNLTSTYESGAAATVLSLVDTGSWKIHVTHSHGGDWPGNFILYTQRTSAGSGSGTISGGSSYIEITHADVELFSGTLDRTGIDIQYKLSGMSVSIPPGTYSATVTFTIIEG